MVYKIYLFWVQNTILDNFAKPDWILSQPQHKQIRLDPTVNIFISIKALFKVYTYR